MIQATLVIPGICLPSFANISFLPSSLNFNLHRKKKTEEIKKKDSEKEIKTYAKVAELFKEDSKQNNIRLHIENNMVDSSPVS